MAAVDPPDATYQPHLPKKLITSGAVSDAQLESTVYAGQAHAQLLPNGQRKGFFVGDGTGVGKGRQIASIILDNFQQGRTKAVWVTKNKKLMVDASRDWEDMGQDKAGLFDIGAKPLNDKLTQGPNSIAFATYGTLRTGIELAPDGKLRASTKINKKTGQAPAQSRIDQIADWLGDKNFDGVIVFDESHLMRKNIETKGTRGKSKPSIQALAGLELQKRFPKARIVYASATGGIEVSDFGYAERLGLWGEGTPFPHKSDFNGAIESGGLAAMEVVSSHLKANGLYLARSLSYEDVTFDRIQHNLSAEQKDLFDTMARAWQTVLKNVNAALEATGVVAPEGSGRKNNGQAKSAAMSKFWGSHQRFFNQILTSLQMPSVLDRIKADLEKGDAVVIQLVNTNEATQNRQIEKIEQDEDATLDDLDLTPRENLMQYIEKGFPTQQFEEYMDENHNIRTRPVTKADGTPVHNRQALAMKQKLLEHLGSLKVPDGPLEYILNQFGEDQVAEVTGRGQRIVQNKNGEKVIQKRSEAITKKDAKMFMDDKKRILVFSDAGGTGQSYHADRRAKNKRHRDHYVVQPGWRADAAMQGLGRTHRTNEESAPHYVLVSTDLNGHRRFISTIARRLSQLGALTRGQRSTASQGLFSEKDNLENRYSRGALHDLIYDLHGNRVPGFGWEIMRKMGFTDLSDDAGILNEDKLPEVQQFLNRLLSLEFDEQNAFFDVFYQRMSESIDRAIEQGTFDNGMQDFKADGIQVANEQVVYQHPDTGAKVRLLDFDVQHNVEFRDPRDLADKKQFFSFVTNNNTGKVFAAYHSKTQTDEKGVVTEHYRLMAPEADKALYTSKESLEKNYTKVDKPAGIEAWKDHIKKAPKQSKEQLHLIEGAMLNIWDRLDSGDGVKVFRVQTDNGKRYVGRRISEEDLPNVMERLGLKGEKKTYTSDEVADKILDQGQTAELATGWKLKRSKVQGEDRIELAGNNLYSFRDEFEKAGMFNEIIDYKTRWFIPVNKAKEIIAKITKSRPVIKLMKAVANQRGSIPLSSLVPSLKKPANDVVKGANGPQDIAFADATSEARFLKAKQGVTPEGLLSRLSQSVTEIRKQMREFPELPDVPEYSQLRTSLLTLQKQKGIAADRTIRRLKSIIQDFGPNKMDVFTRKVLLDDLVREAEAKRALPFGLTPEAVERERDKIDDLLRQNPDIAEAVARRQAAWRDVKGRYQVAMRSIGLDKLADRLSKEDYFRHQVLEYANERRKQPAGAGKELKSPTGRGFSRQRHGSEKDINANYLQADYEVMAQMEHDIAVAKTIRLVDKEHNIIRNLKRAAKQANDTEVQKRIAGDMALEAQWMDWKQRIGMGLSKVRQALALNKHAIISFDQLKSYAEQEGHPAQGGALMAFKAMSERRQWIKEFLGKDFQTWEDRIPEGYQVWQPEPGNVFFMAETIPHRLARQLTEGLMQSANISPEQLRAVLAMGGPKEQYVIPDEVYHTLRSLAQPIPPIWQRTIRQVQGHWKQVMLLAPRRFLRYNIRNLTGDMDAVFAGNPSAMKQLPKAMHDLWPVFFGKDVPLTGEVKEWFDRGGFQSTLQVQEMGDLNELKIFRESLEREAKGGILSIPARVFNGYWKKARLSTDYREAMLRYANYLSYLEQMRSNATNKPANWGASIPENVMALPDLRDRAFKLSNELLGAYDRVSAIGQNLRNYWYPFFSWVEVNFRRYKQLIKNAFRDIGSAKLARLGGVATVKAAKWLLRFSLLWAALQAWNYLMFPDDEDELDEATRNRPHILFGRSEEGKIRYLAGIGAMGDLLSWFGLDTAPAVTRDVLKGKMSVAEALKEMAKAPVNKLVQGVTPFVKTPAELLARESAYPDVFHPRPIQDRGEYLAQQLTLQKEYGKLTGKPQGKDDLAGLVIQRQDPGSAAYTDWAQIETKFMEKLGKERGIYFRSPKSQALRNLSRAIQEKDVEAEAVWRQKYEEMGGNRKSMEASIRALAPLYGMSRADRDQLLSQLDASDRKILKRAEAYYEERLTQVLPPNDRARLLRKLKQKGWLSKEEPDLPSFLTPDLPDSP